MSIDVEVTLNRFGFYRPASNKVQVGCLRIAWWKVPGKHSIGFEMNWRTSRNLRPARAQ